MTRLLPRILLILMAFAIPAAIAQPVPPAIEEFRPLPLHEAARRVGDRYTGRLVSAQPRPPHPTERDQGVALVYEFRLITPHRQMLLIRVDARNGDFLEVAGRGQIEALRDRTGRQQKGRN